MPVEYTSDRMSTFWPVPCSGDMYAGEPNTAPIIVSFFAGPQRSSSTNFASPKSRIFATYEPSASRATKTFSVFMSR